MSAPKGKKGAPRAELTLLEATGKALEHVAHTIANAPDPAATVSRLLDWIKEERARFPRGRQ